MSRALTNCVNRSVWDSIERMYSVLISRSFRNCRTTMTLMSCCVYGLSLLMMLTKKFHSYLQQTCKSSLSSDLTKSFALENVISRV